MDKIIAFASIALCAFLVYIAVTGERDPEVIHCLRNPESVRCQ